jgi:hypothetical protein
MEMLRRDANTIMSTSIKPKLDDRVDNSEGAITLGESIGIVDNNFELAEILATVDSDTEKLILRTVIEAGTIVDAESYLHRMGYSKINFDDVEKVATKYAKMYANVQ